MKIKLKKGMAIPIVLIFAVIMGFVSIHLVKNAQSSNRQTQTSLDQLQSYFIARAGVEHAMLKVKYLNRELYDAMCMAQGRNPLFDFSQIKDSDLNENTCNPWKAINEYNPGPIFLYPITEEKKRRSMNGGKIIGLTSDMKDAGPIDANTWLDIFKSDLKSKENPIASNKILDISDINDQLHSLGDSSFNDYFIAKKDSAEYLLTDVKVAASKVEEKSEKIDNNIIVEFTVKSTFTSSKNDDYDYEIKRSLKVSRE